MGLKCGKSERDILYLKLELTNYIQQSPAGETISSSATQEIPHILWNLKVHYCVHKNISLETIPSR
jgi:hypothetical protein